MADIQRQLAPDAEVTHNAKLPGRFSETERQIDVLVEQPVGQCTIRIIIDCKDHRRPIDVKGVEQFSGLMSDVGAQKGALVCPRGFTKAAKKLAAQQQIALYSPIDTDPHKWRATVHAAILCDFRGMRVSFGLKTTAPKPFVLQYEFYEMDAFDEDGNSLGCIKDVAINNWDSGKYPSEVGVHSDLEIFFDQKTFVDNGYDDLVEVELSANLDVRSKRYFGQLPIEKIRGFKDEHTGGIVTNAFTTGVLDAATVEQEWQEIAEGEEPPSDVTIVIVGLSCYGYGA